MTKKDGHAPNEEKSFQEKQKEAWVSQWIDDLNHEKKPREDAVEDSSISDEEKKELYEVLDTLRRVKSLKPVENETEQEWDNERDKEWNNERATERDRARMAESVPHRGKGFNLRKQSWAIAVVLVLVLIMGIAPMFTGDGGSSVVHAMEAALENLGNYKGTINFQMVMNEQVMQESTTELTVGENGSFHSVTEVAGREITRFYPGQDQLYTVYNDRENFVEISHMGEESLSFYQEIFLMETILEEIQEAVEIKAMGKETLNGRETTKYHYRYHEDVPYHELWVDESTDLPIKVAHHSQNGDRMVRTMKDLELNLPDLSGDLFTYEVTEDTEIHYTSPEAEE